MRFAMPVVIAGSFAVALAGCGESEEQAPSGPQAPADTSAMEDQAGDMAQQAEAAWEEARDAFVAETRAQVEQLEARIAEMRAEAESEEATEAMQNLVSEAEASLDAVRADLQRLQEAGAEQWESIRDSLANSLDELEQQVRADGA